MNRDRLRELLESVKRGEVDLDNALERIARLPFVDAIDARVDTHRALSHGFQQCRLNLGRRPVDFVGQHQVVENRALLEMELSGLRPVDFSAGDIAGK